MSSAQLLSSTGPASRQEIHCRDVPGQASPAELYRDHYPTLAGWCNRMINNQEDAHDIASEAFARLLGRWKAVTDPRAYLFTTALNLTRDRWRRIERELVAIRKSQVTLRTEAPPDPELRMLVAALPRRQQQVVVLRYFSDLPVDTIAAALGITAGTVKSQLFDARARLAIVVSNS